MDLEGGNGAAGCPLRNLSEHLQWIIWPSPIWGLWCGLPLFACPFVTLQCPDLYSPFSRPFTQTPHTFFAHPITTCPPGAWVYRDKINSKGKFKVPKSTHFTLLLAHTQAFPVCSFSPTSQSALLDSAHCYNFLSEHPPSQLHPLFFIGEAPGPSQVWLIT